MADQTPTPIGAVINTTAPSPATESIDGQTVTERPLADLVEADRHQTGGVALSKPGFGLRVAFQPESQNLADCSINSRIDQT